MYTTDIKKFRESDLYKQLPADFANSIPELRPTFSTVISKYAPLPPCKLCCTGQRATDAQLADAYLQKYIKDGVMLFNGVVFDKPVILKDINQISVSKKTWIYLPGQPGTLSQDGQMLALPVTVTANCVNGDQLVGFVNGDFNAGQTLPVFTPAPADWTTPVQLFDLAQFNDKVTYDGKFPSMVCEARQLYNTQNCVFWQYYTDYFKVQNGQVIQPKYSKSQLYDILDDVYEKLEQLKLEIEKL